MTSALKFVSYSITNVFGAKPPRDLYCVVPFNVGVVLREPGVCVCVCVRAVRVCVFHRVAPQTAGREPRTLPLPLSGSVV